MMSAKASMNKLMIFSGVATAVAALQIDIHRTDEDIAKGWGGTMVQFLTNKYHRQNFIDTMLVTAGTFKFKEWDAKPTGLYMTYTFKAWIGKKGFKNPERYVQIRIHLRTDENESSSDESSDKNEFYPIKIQVMVQPGPGEPYELWWETNNGNNVWSQLQKHEYGKMFATFSHKDEDGNHTSEPFSIYPWVELYKHEYAKKRESRHWMSQIHGYLEKAAQIANSYEEHPAHQTGPFFQDSKRYPFDGKKTANCIFSELKGGDACSPLPGRMQKYFEIPKPNTCVSFSRSVDEQKTEE